MNYDESWDRPHQAGPEDGWQESDCYWFYDAAAGIGGYHRIGMRPNRGTAQVMLMAFELGGERFTLNDSFTRDRRINAANRSDVGQHVDGHSAQSLGESRMRYLWDEGDTAADLEFYESFYEPRGWPGHSSDVMKNVNAGGHLECSGRIRGEIRIGSATHTIDALAHRDRSWGFRDHSMIEFHRYRLSSGTIGPEFSFASHAITLRGLGSAVGGFIARNGITEDVIDVRVLTTLDADGFTSMGSRTVLTLAGGEKVQVPGSVVQGFVNPLGEGTFATCSIAEIDWNGAPGFQNLEVSPNPGRGTYIPTPADGSLHATESGLSKAADHRL
ncbi:DUF7065 domain-containing protein [Mycolicibacterium sp. 22603]|uniref:DUF7065 domain-containing protein n=1 Tax=Mycolicibacterium sp. 22603 TaxID=3453950 RepID=UPI003F839CBA